MNRPELLNSYEPQPLPSASSAHLSGGTSNPPRLARRGAGALLAVLFAAAAFLMGAPAANAASDPHFEQYSLSANVQADGTMDVEIDIDYDFQDEESRGIFLTYYSRQEIEGETDRLRVFRYRDVEVSSSTGASTTVEAKEEDNNFIIRIGDEDKADLTGLHSYHVSFTVEGIPNPGVGEDGEDEIYWNVIGSGFNERVEDIRVEITAPNAPQQVTCHAGISASDEACDAAKVDGDTAIFTHDAVDPGRLLTVAAEYEPRTFPRAEILTTRTPSMGGAGLAKAAGAIVLVLTVIVAVLGRQKKRDQAYEGLPPGVIADKPVAAPTTIAPRKENFPVRFEPPEKIGPATTAVLVNKKFRAADLPITIIDLAVRGFVTIDVDMKGNWTFQPTGTEANVKNRHEKQVLAAITARGKQPTTIKDLPKSARRKLYNEQRKVLRDATSTGLFVKGASKAQARRGAAAFGFMGLSLFTVTLGFRVGLGWLGLAPVGIGLGLLVTRKHVPVRTAKGHALYAQAMGFRTYLATAEANQLKFEAGRDIFSEYLPYAIAFGVEARWKDLFDDLISRGEWTITPSWHRGSTISDGRMRLGTKHGMRSEMRSLARSTSRSVRSAAPASTGSSGGSGFSSSSSSSAGGGVGGGGGGRW